MPFWRRSPPPAGEHVAGLWLIVGLGNPGAKFDGTRHNVGFMLVERLADRYGLRFKGSKHRADIARGTLAGHEVLLAMPLTYMNESGNAVIRLLNYYQVPRSRLLVVCDDMDLPFGTLRLRPNGSAGGQRGLASIIQSLGSSRVCSAPHRGEPPPRAGDFPCARTISSRAGGGSARFAGQSGRCSHHGDE